MKLNEIVGKEKAKSMGGLLKSIKNGVFTKDGSSLLADTVLLAHCQLHSLEGCPSIISGDFYCQSNELVSLKGGPKKVGGTFFCERNNLTSLEGFPEEVGGAISVISNKLTSLKNIHKHIKKIGGIFIALKNPIESHVLGLLKIPGCTSVRLDNKTVEVILNKYLPEGDLIDCQEELIEAGFPEYAQL